MFFGREGVSNVREEREREGNKILRDSLTTTCDGDTFWLASEFEKRETQIENLSGAELTPPAVMLRNTTL